MTGLRRTIDMCAQSIINGPSTQAVSEWTNFNTEKVVQPHTRIKRVAWIEYFTIISALAVVLVHVVHGIIVTATDPSVWWAGNIVDSMARWAVPVFVMMSGYLLLDPERDYTLGSFYKKRAARILVPLVFWSVFFAAFSLVLGTIDHQPAGLKEIGLSILNGKPFYHLWYLYMLVGLYLFAPFIRKMVASTSKRELVFICIVLILFPVAVNAANYFHYDIYDQVTNGSLFITWFLSYLGYFIAGHLLIRTVTIKLGLATLITIFTVSVLLTAGGCYFLTARHSYELGQFFGSYLSPTVVPMSLSAYLIGKKIFTRLPGNKFVSRASIWMLGVYVIHPFFIEVFNRIGFEPLKFNPLVGIPLVTLCIFLISLALAVAIKQIKYIKYTI